MTRSILMQIPERVPSEYLEKILEYFHKKYREMRPRERHPYDTVCVSYQLVPGSYLMLNEGIIRAIVIDPQKLNTDDIVIRYPLKCITIGEL